MYECQYGGVFSAISVGILLPIIWKPRAVQLNWVAINSQRSCQLAHEWWTMPVG